MPRYRYTKRRRALRRTRQKGGMKSRLDVPLQTFLDTFTTYYIGGHGSIPFGPVPGLHKNILGISTLRVPPNTYILHVAPSGQTCGSAADEDALLDSMTFSPAVLSVKTPKGIDDLKIKSLTRLHKLFTGTEADRRNLNYDSRIYTSSPAGGGGGGGGGGGSAAPADILTGIYEPGDIVSDLFFKFANKESIIDLGVFKAPFDHSFFERIQDMRIDLSALTAADKKEEFLEASDQIILRYPGNIIGEEMADKPRDQRVKRLSQILADPRMATTAEKPVRVFIIFTCRSITPPKGVNLPPSIKEYVRRRSISQRNRLRETNSSLQTENIPGFSIARINEGMYFKPLHAAAPAAAPAATITIPLGANVVIHSLDNKPEYNGIKGIIINNNMAGGLKVGVRLENGRELQISKTKLAIISENTPLPSTIVVPFDLTDKTYVGKVGQVTGSDPANPTRLSVKFKEIAGIKSLPITKLAIASLQYGL